MYVCGVTPYDETHLGHARCYVFFDTVGRFFKSAGYEVMSVQNFTDIDDKIIAKAIKLDQPFIEISKQFIQDYFDRMTQLNVQKANVYTRVSEFMPQIIRWIQKLVDKKFAYVVDGEVYYAVSKFADYGKLSKRALSEMEAGARVEINEKKENPLDFSLWKKGKEGEPSWDSPWGKGRPGWHIECSVMSMELLGETFDIHGGGQDLIFPHHENEIAQSEGATGKPFVRYWMHNGFVTINREKMSKSLGNFFTLREIFEKYSPEVVRLFLLSRHYRTPLDFSDDLLQQAKSSYHTLRETYESAAFLLEDSDGKTDSILEDWEEKIAGALSDDFNTEKAIAVVFQLRNEMVEKIKNRDFNWLIRAKKTLGYFCNDLLGISLQSSLTSKTIKELKEKLDQRDQYRKKKDWENADKIRKEIESIGYFVEDTPAGALAKPKLS